MKLARYAFERGVGLALVRDDQVFDLESILPGVTSWRQCLGEGETFWRHVDDAKAAPSLPLEMARLKTPIPDPQKILAIGMNYRAHVAEARELGIAVPNGQLWFNKQVSALSGPFDPIIVPDGSAALDYEGELGVIIGRPCRAVNPAEAEAAIFGYLICNDVSVRDWQFASPTITLGKSYDTHCPAGPWISKGLAIEDVMKLTLTTQVNGKVRQQSPLSDMIHSIPEQVSHLSNRMTLMPGDLVLTGTPAGVGAVARPPAFLRVGDRVAIKIEELGAIENIVI